MFPLVFSAMALMKRYTSAVNVKGMTFPQKLMEHTIFHERKLPVSGHAIVSEPTSPLVFPPSPPASPFTASLETDDADIGVAAS
jgi:hypothetical protein